MTSADRQARRRQRLKQAAQAAGYPTIDKLAQAILEGEIKMDKRIYKASEQINANDRRWIVDLSEGNAVNPDAFWFFVTRKQAQQFTSYVDQGIRAEEAQYKVLGD